MIVSPLKARFSRVNPSKKMYVYIYIYHIQIISNIIFDMIFMYIRIISDGQIVDNAIWSLGAIGMNRAFPEASRSASLGPLVSTNVCSWYVHFQQ